MRFDVSPERRAHALAWIREEGLLDAPLTYPARLAAAVGVLICDDAGRFTKTDLAEALDDPSVVQVARALLREARC